MKNFFQEFKTFAARGNAIELAIGVVIGAAFGQITTTLATNVITPPIGALMGGFDFSKLAFSLGGSAVIGYGLFLQALINFIVIAFALFLLLKGINRLTRKKEPEEAKPVETEELKVLREIRDRLVQSR
jgi:large conductance mechanosensitive channel